MYNNHHLSLHVNPIETSGSNAHVQSITRSSQLIKRVTAPDGLRPSDLLIERFQVWKAVCNCLLIYFQGISAIEERTSSELHRLGNVVQDVLPFRSSLFLSQGGFQDILYGLRERTNLIAGEHEALGKTVDASVVLHLQKLKNEVKLHIKNIMQDTGKLANIVSEEREKSTKLITTLIKGISLSKNAPFSVDWRQDPWYCNQLVYEQLLKQVHRENLLQKSIFNMQVQSAHFEEALVRSLQTAYATYQEHLERMQREVCQHWAAAADLFSEITPIAEWEPFRARDDCLLDPETPMRDPKKINYPGVGDPSTKAIYQGVLKRKKKFTKSYQESYFVLTPSGFLHEFKSSDLKRYPVPELSIFLLECTLGAPSSKNSRLNKLTITLGKKGHFGRPQAHTLLAKGYHEMMEWWDHLKDIVKVYQTASAPVDRGGVVPEAVRAIGYPGNGEVAINEPDTQGRIKPSPAQEVAEADSGSSHEAESSFEEAISPATPVETPRPVESSDSYVNFPLGKTLPGQEAPRYTSISHSTIKPTKAEKAELEQREAVDVKLRPEVEREEGEGDHREEEIEQGRGYSTDSKNVSNRRPSQGSAFGLMLSRFTENFVS